MRKKIYIFLIYSQPRYLSTQLSLVFKFRFGAVFFFFLSSLQLLNLFGI